MTLKSILIIFIAFLLAACSNYDDQRLIVEKNAESFNGIKISISLVGGNEIECGGEIRYNDILLNKFKIKSHNEKNQESFLINYSEFPDISLQLATDFVLDLKPRIEVSVYNKENFSRKGYIELTPIIPPVMTGIALQSKEIAAKYPLNYQHEIDETEFFINHKNLNLDQYTIARIATLSTLIKSNTKILSSIIVPETKIPIYKGKSKLKVSVQCDTFSLNPRLVLYPSPHNKYYDGPNLFQVANTFYNDDNLNTTLKRIAGDKVLIERNFDVKELTGEYDLFMIIRNQSGIYFYYDMGEVIFDNVAPEFDEYNTGSYYFAGDASFEGKVYLDYTIPVKRNPYDVIFSGMVYGDVKSIYVDGKPIDFSKDGNLLFSREIYIKDGYKDVRISIRDELGNSKNYNIPIIVSQ